MYHDQLAPIYIAAASKRQPPFSLPDMPRQPDSNLPQNLPANTNSVTTTANSNILSSYASPVSTMDANAAKKRAAISNLMSPPEPRPHETFSHGDTAAPSATLQAEGKGKRTKPMISPPESPAIAANYIDDAATSRDPILYPSSRDYLTSAASSLFTQPKDHTDEAPPHPTAGLEKRLRQDMRNAGECLFEIVPASYGPEIPGHVRLVCKLGQCYKADPKGWLGRQRAQNLADREARKRRREREERERKAAVAARMKSDARGAVMSPPTSDEIRVSEKALRPQRPSRVTKPARPKSSHSSNGTPPKSAPAKSAPAKPSPAKLTPEGSPPTDAKHSSPDGKHSDFASLPDYCPPLDSLPNKPNWYKIDWKGVPSVLTDDPNRHLLHADEVRLAETLKLDCALYLAAKRRFFIRRLECARIRKPFRKTDAQQACRIDVNKASRLWTVFERVGWLEEKWVKPFM